MNTEQERADFEAWAQNSFELHRHSAGEYSSNFTQTAWAAWQARAALQPQPTEAFPCRIIEADFETGTVTLEMQGKYTASAGQKYLCNAPLQSQDREDAFCVWHNDPETDNSWDTSCRQLFEIYDGTPAENRMKFCCYCGKPIREAIDAARAQQGGQP